MVHCWGMFTMGHPHLQRSPKQPCGPGTRLGASRNATARSVPHVFSRVLGIGASSQPPRPWPCLPRAPSLCSGLRWHTSPGTHSKRVDSVTSGADLWGCRTKSYGLLCPLPLVLPLGTTEKSLAPSSLLLPLGTLL